MFSYYRRVHVLLGAVRILVLLAPSRGGVPQLGETQSAEPTLGDPCYGPATAHHPPGPARERWGASRRGRPVFLSFQRSCRPYDSVAVGGARGRPHHPLQRRSVLLGVLAPQCTEMINMFVIVDRAGGQARAARIAQAHTGVTNTRPVTSDLPKATLSPPACVPGLHVRLACE